MKNHVSQFMAQSMSNAICRRIHIDEEQHGKSINALTNRIN